MYSYLTVPSWTLAYFEYPLAIITPKTDSALKMAAADVITTIIRRNRPGTKAAVGFYCYIYHF